MSQEEKLPKILIVEDDERLARLTQEYLIRNGLEVGVETDGNRAIRRIISEQPDLVVLDVMLPGKTGIEVCREIRAVSGTPIIMLTAKTESDDVVLGLEAGAELRLAAHAAVEGHPDGIAAGTHPRLAQVSHV